MDEKQLELDKKYLRMAQVWAENSYAVRKKVGCLIVKDKMIISDGYNGTPSGFPNICEDVYMDGKKLEKLIYPLDIYAKTKGTILVTKDEVLHAEANAITKLAKSGNSSEGATLYVTYEPCLGCSKLIIQSGIKRVVYFESYRVHDGVELLKKAGIKVEQVNI